MPPWTRSWFLAWMFVALCVVFTADLWVADPKRTRFRYRLAPRDADWREETSQPIDIPSFAERLFGTAIAKPKR